MAVDFRLVVPLQQYPGMAHLLHLPDTTIQQLASALYEAPVVLSPPELVSYLVAKVDLSSSVIDEVVQVLVSLTNLRLTLQTALAEIVDAVAQAVADTKVDTLQPANDEWKPFKARLTTLLAAERVLGVVAKATALWLEHARVFQDARVITDLRPVFSGTPDDSPVAFLLIHTLKLNYHQDNETRELFIAMDSRDVRQLRAVLNRADTKADSLKALLKATNIPVLDALTVDKGDNYGNP